MAVPHQRWIIAGVWAFILGSALFQAPSLREINFGPLEAKSRFLWTPALFGLLAPPLVAILNYFTLRSRPYHPGLVARWVDRRWGSGSAFRFLRDLRAGMAVGCGAFLMGLIGTLFCIGTNAAPEALGISLFFLFGGAWFVVMSILSRKWLPHIPW